MSESLATVSYIGATILFILCLGGLSNQESARRGNLYGMIGMAIAVLATVLGPRILAAGLPWVVGAMAVGAAIGVYAARVVQMTQMPELVALMHSLVGLAAVLVGYANFVDPAVGATLSPAEHTIHKIETYLGVLIGAYAPLAFLGHFTVFVLACFVGYMVVWNVKPALHTPLMSVTNAISSIIAIGALIQVGPEGLIRWLAVTAIALTAVNMFGGFAVTQRMLQMFRK